MEHIPIPRFESEPTKDDDPRRLIVEQLSAKRDKALARLQKAEQQATELQTTIDKVGEQFSLPTVFIEVAYIGAEFEQYTYSEHTRDVRQYALTTDSVTEALTATASYITESGIAQKDHFEPQLKSISIGIGNDQLVALELTAELGLQQYFKPEY